MEHIDKISEVVWHECGHLIISIISNKTILGFTIERNSEYNGSLHVSFGGNVCLNEIDDNIDIDVKSLCLNIINYFSGSIFQSFYNNNCKAINLFINGKSNKKSDYFAFFSIMEKYEIEHKINIASICFPYFQKVENLITEHSILECIKTNCSNILKDYPSISPVKYSLDENALKKIISDFSNEISLTNLDNQINDLVDNMCNEIRKARTANKC